MSSIFNDNLVFSGKDKIDSAYRNAEWLITAFANTLVFIIFVMQVYRIPTGSMAETLRGAHFRIRCGQCGFRYDHDFIAQRYGMSDTITPSQKLPIGPRSSRCPSCGYAEPAPIRSSDGRYFIYKDGKTVPAFARTVFKGDQIFVIKCIYQFFQPKRWDVIVFKNPLEPRINYIKRCIALPGETLQIIDGDIYINGLIQRKPPNVQEELWMVVYHNDFPPARPDEKSFNGHTWRQPFECVEASQWNLSADGPTVFELKSSDSAIHRIQYNDRQGNDFRATYAYDDPASYPMMPLCSDLMAEYYASIGQNSAAGAQIRKYGIAYEGWIHSDGRMEIARLSPAGEPVIIAAGQCRPDDLKRITRFRFATLDHQLILEYGSSKVAYDLGNGIEDAGTDYHIRPLVQIFGIGSLRLSHIALYRDIHYISDNIKRGTKESPMVMHDGEYFACGDNSPFSLDSRLWDRPGLANPGRPEYPAGIVPQDYLVGKAFVVHWPGGYRIEKGPLSRIPIRWIPFVDGMKVIYGGTE
ncbi:MAG TPA: signal peptidase I [Anaerohalosphaeraceae bacterium]|nr:signal peptidase I [Anaerohalosphaeraceae bacterium]HOL32342.1 signal peptidase I [Anaerohalosphaeraceae bacterium]HOM74986.1 signal peptidase I [Anaerohalosphaeraceae bacterium]HPC63237.1 signal peptidase I [Anaerohalosphaeraceae bacterium]HPO69290.1 signal peptidase I [Anaerohalosphaeraceae bacterium]